MSGPSFIFAVYERYGNGGDIFEGSAPSALLIRAAQEGYFEIFKFIYEHGRASNIYNRLEHFVDSFGNTPLHYAATITSPEKRLDVESIILFSKKIFFFKNKVGQTAAHIAAKYSNPFILYLLWITFKEEMYTTDLYGNTPLHYASYHGNVNTLNGMLKNMDGVKFMDVRNSENKNIAHVAYESKNFLVRDVIKAYIN